MLPREKFATLFNSKLLSAVRILAEEEGRQLQVLVEEAHADLIEKRFDVMGECRYFVKSKHGARALNRVKGPKNLIHRFVSAVGRSQ